MTTNSNIVQNIELMKISLEADLAAARNGNIIDISKLPDQLVILHREVSALESPNKEDLSKSFEELLELLDLIAQEIHRRYEGLNQQLKVLDPSPRSPD